MNEMQVIEHEGMRVITTRQVAEAYKTTTKRVSNNFTAHKDRFKEGKHYFKLSGEEKANFLDRPEIKDGLKKARLLYDERGN